MSNFYKVTTLALLSTLGLITLPAQASVILFQDNFAADSGTSAMNFNSFLNWTVDNGTADYIRMDNIWGITNCVNGCVDIDGSIANGGRMTTKPLFNLSAADSYQISVDVSGNQRSGSVENLTFGMLGLNNFNFNSILPGNTFTTLTGTFTGLSGLASLFIETGSNDNEGAILDNVRFECISCNVVSNPATVPEPDILGLLALGLLGLGLVKNRRKNQPCA